jgi:hypothetical protein
MKATKISKHKNQTSYRVGKWLVTVERKSIRSYSCGLSRTASWSQWNAINMDTLSVSDNRSGNGGIREASAKLNQLATA